MSPRPKTIIEQLNRGLNPALLPARILKIRRLLGRGFTLLELLVAIAIIGILAALLVPALGRAKARALQSVCMSNFKQLTLSWKMYADESNGKLVPVAYNINGVVNTNAWVRGSMNDRTRVYPPIDPGVRDSTNLNGIKLGSLYHYGSAVGVYRCPSDKSNLKGVLRVRSYSINAWMGGKTVLEQTNYTVYRRESDIINPPPSSAWVFIDEHEHSINDGWFAVDMRGHQGFLDLPANRHGNGYALSFADGHVEVWKFLDPRSSRWPPFHLNVPVNPDWQRLSAASSSLK